MGAQQSREVLDRARKQTQVASAFQGSSASDSPGTTTGTGTAAAGTLQVPIGAVPRAQPGNKLLSLRSSSRNVKVNESQKEFEAVLKDRPKNIFGPGHTFSPDAYGVVYKGKARLDTWLMEFSALDRMEKEASMETFAYFQGKMGLLMREADKFGAYDTEYDLFLACKQLTRTLFDLPDLRLWEFDAASRTAILTFNRTTDDRFNGLAVPALGTLPGEIARTKRVEIITNCASDSRFNSHQLREMQVRRVRTGWGRPSSSRCVPT